VVTSRSPACGSSLHADRRGIVATLWPHLRPELASLVGSLALGLLIAALSASQPLLTRMVIDDGLIGRHFDQLALACGGMLAIALVGTLLGGVHRAIYVRASGHALFSLRRALYAHLMRVSPRRLGTIPVGDLVTRLDGDVAEVQRFGTDSAATFIGSLLTLLVVSGVMLQLSWRLSVLVLALLPLQLLVRHYARPAIERSTRSVREAAGNVSGFLIETLAGARAVQAAAAQRLEDERLAALGDDYLSRVIRAQLVAYATSAVAGLLGNLATAAVFLLGGWYVLHDALSVGTLVAYVSYLGRSAGSASSLVGLYTGYQRARVSLERLGDLSRLPAVPEAADALPLAADARGDLRLDGITVRVARDGSPVLDAVDLQIAAGTKLVLGGISGAGKSTLTDVLRRFVEPDEGSVSLDGTPLNRYRLDDLRRRIVVVEHSPVLFRGSILDNLRYGHPTADADAVRAAATRAGVDDFVRELPAGYETQVGEGGAGLSTGQRQRIALARAALGDPLVVILDEATSGLDRESALAIHRALDSCFAHRTRLVITHHAQDIEQVDQWWLLQDGRLTRGSPGG
jgi:ATP-binding cassette subfamily B protein